MNKEELCFKCRIKKGFKLRDNGAHTAMVKECEGCGEVRAILSLHHWVRGGVTMNTCECGKISYDSKQDAINVRGLHAKHKANALGYYKCRLSGKYHLGRRQQLNKSK